jgi:hypothetical protein
VNCRTTSFFLCLTLVPVTYFLFIFSRFRTVVYVSYNTRLDKSDDTNKSRFKSSLCAVNLDDYTLDAAPSAAASAKQPAAVAP